jgi:hypothetical protein
MTKEKWRNLFHFRPWKVHHRQKDKPHPRKATNIFFLLFIELPHEAMSQTYVYI